MQGTFSYIQIRPSEDTQCDSERRAGDVWLKRKAWSVKKYFLPYRCFSRKKHGRERNVFGIL
jgi:hypothetical protein